MFMLVISGIGLYAQTTAQDKSISLIVRGDDIGSCHAANVACIRSYKEGIMTSVELMVPCSWFPEAVKMLNENPGLDVGIHLVLTSEWENYKWRPLTHAPSLTDADGYFYPRVFPLDALVDIHIGVRHPFEGLQPGLSNHPIVALTIVGGITPVYAYPHTACIIRHLCLLLPLY